MSVATATYAARRAASKRMIDWCRVERPDPAAGGPAPLLNPVTGQYDNLDDLSMKLIYEGPFSSQVRSDINSNAVEAVIGEHEYTYRTATVEFPVHTPKGAKGSTSAILADDILTYVRCRLDPAMNGRVLNLQADVKGKTAASKRRFRTRELLG